MTTWAIRVGLSVGMTVGLVVVLGAPAAAQAPSQVDPADGSAGRRRSGPDLPIGRQLVTMIVVPRDGNGLFLTI